jgi:hypothetical protein
VAIAPALGEAARGGLGERPGPGVHDGVEAVLDLGLVGLADLVEDVADLVRPAAPDRDVRERGGRGGREPGAAIDADHLEALAGEPAADQVAEEALPGGGALGRRRAEGR